jgi:hypothetical protein
MKWLIFIACISCHQQVTERLKLDQETQLDRESHTTVTDDSAKSAELFSQQNVTGGAVDWDAKLDVEATPTKPARHYEMHRHQDPVQTETVVHQKEKEKAKEVVMSEAKDKSKSGAKTDFEGTKTSDTGFGWKFYLAVVAVIVAILLAVLYALRKKLWRPL